MKMEYNWMRHWLLDTRRGLVVYSDHWQFLFIHISALPVRAQKGTFKITLPWLWGIDSWQIFGADRHSASVFFMLIYMFICSYSGVTHTLATLAICIKKHSNLSDINPMKPPPLPSLSVPQDYEETFVEQASYYGICYGRKTGNVVRQINTPKTHIFIC